MSNRSIRRIVHAKGFKMGKIYVKQPLPATGIGNIDPFLLLHHAGPFDIPAGTDYKTEGVGPHPHRGFEPVSFVFQGSLSHRDSLGNTERLEAGDTQWMTSGKGIIHSERPDKQIATTGGTQEFIQLWVNLPKAHKMSAPGYQNIIKKEVTPLSPDNGKGEIYVLAGSQGNTKGKATTFTPINACRCEFEANASHVFELPTSHNALLYVLKGSAVLNGNKRIGKEEMAYFNNDGDAVHIETSEDTWFIVLSGEPIDEPVATYGPFVMNTQEELAAAVHDYNSGKMGRLIENFD